MLAESSGNTVVANRIGANPTGTVVIPNGDDGLKITRRADGNEVGGTEFVDSATGQANDPTGDQGTVPPVFIVSPLGNLISGNAQTGVITGSGSRDNVLKATSSARLPTGTPRSATATTACGSTGRITIR